VRTRATAEVVEPIIVPEAAAASASAADEELSWTADAQKELQKIPFFVRGKARRNTERYAKDAGVMHITIETLYDAKAHYGR
jgi:light-independent protochlorophyllide reductase subunit B